MVMDAMRMYQGYVIEWTGSILPEGNRRKENFYAAKSMMKPPDLGYQKIDMCPNFCMLYYRENTKLTKCKPYGHSHYKTRTGRWRTLVAHKKSPDCKGYSCHQRLLSTWHDINLMIWWMKWWCTLLMSEA
jgi:hypothetical protein